MSVPSIITRSLLLLLALVVGACATAPAATGPFLIKDAETLEAGERSSAMLSTRDSINPKDGSPYRVYEVELERDQILSIEVDSADFMPAVALYTGDGDLIGRSAFNPYEMEQNSRLIRRVTSSGTHLIVVSSGSANERGSFDLRTELIDEELDAALPGSVQGYLYGGARRTHPDLLGPLAVIPLELTETAALSFSVRSRDFDAYVAVVDPETEEVLAEEYGYQHEPASFLTELGPGTYEVWVSARPESGDGRYRLTVEEAEIQRSEEFVFGQRFFGFLGSAQERIPGGSHRRGEPIEFTMDEDATLDVVMRSEHLDAYLVITDSDGRIVTEDDDSGGGLDARITWPLEAGDYTLWATSYHGSETGPYFVEASLAEMIEGTGEIEMDSTITGSLSQADAQYPQRQGTFVRYYTLEVESEGSVQIDLKSEEFDAYLLLEDEEGRLIEENDDVHMGNTDSRIIRTLAPGTYRIGVTTFSVGEVGSYTLEVRRAAPSGTSV